MAKPKKTPSPAHGSHDHGADDGPQGHGDHGHRPHNPLCEDPDYKNRTKHRPSRPSTREYPDPRIYGRYASKNPPRYVPHPFEHTCFKPRKEDYKPPITCDEHDTDLCVRKDHRR